MQHIMITYLLPSYVKVFTVESAYKGRANSSSSSSRGSSSSSSSSSSINKIYRISLRVTQSRKLRPYNPISDECNLPR